MAERTETYTLRFDKDVGIPMSDGLTLRANIFRPQEAGRFPVIAAQSP